MPRNKDDNIGKASNATLFALNPLKPPPVLVKSSAIDNDKPIVMHEKNAECFQKPKRSP
jgi:hypothetical protein